jgi:hypothetical protein
MIEEILRVGSDDILYRLRKEERERAEKIKLWRASVCNGSIRDDDHVHELVRDAAREIARPRMLLHEATRHDPHCTPGKR